MNRLVVTRRFRLAHLSRPLRLPLICLSSAALLAFGATNVSAQRTPVYNPIPMPDGNIITDTLSSSDIPTGNGGFARDYSITLQSGDQLVMDLRSEEFDTIITLISPDGRTIGQNDDGPDGTTNSLLFTRITESGEYILRVSPFGGRGSGTFTLEVTRLRPVGEECP